MKNLCNEKTLGHYITGEIADDFSQRTLACAIGPYEVLVVVDEHGRFINVKEIKKNADFRSIEQKINQTNFIDVDEFYQDE
jgi:hypothetical protein